MNTATTRPALGIDGLLEVLKDVPPETDPLRIAARRTSSEYLPTACYEKVRRCVCGRDTFGSMKGTTVFPDTCQPCLDKTFPRDEDVHEERPEPAYLEMDGPMDTRSPGYSDRERCDGLDD